MKYFDSSKGFTQITVLSRPVINSNHFEYQSATFNSNGIIHILDPIMGFDNSENKELIFGVLYKEHNSGVYFQWYRNEETFASETDFCLIVVTETGNYIVSVSTGETLTMCICKSGVSSLAYITFKCH